MEKIRSDFLYFLTAVIALLGIVAICISFLTTLSPAADIAELIEFDLTSLEEGEHVQLNIYGSPIYIRHRSPEDIKAVHASYVSSIYPERDEDRLLTYKGKKDPRYIIFKASNPWCLPIPNAGDFKDQGGLYCRHYASHFDGSGRLQKGGGWNFEIPRNARLSSATTVQFWKIQ